MQEELILMPLCVCVDYVCDLLRLSDNCFEQVGIIAVKLLYIADESVCRCVSDVVNVSTDDNQNT